MSDTTFVDYVTPAVNAEWLNEVNDHVWHDTPVSGTTVHNASVIAFTPTGTGSVATTTQAKLRESVSVKDFGAVGDGVADDTAEIQAAVTHAIASGYSVFMPAGTYLITDSITCSSKTQIIGEHYSMSATNNGTKISFAPTAAKDLFVLGSGAGFTDAYSFQNLYIVGNSTTSTGNSFRAFNLTKVIKSTFKNMRIDGFRTAFKLSGTINNRFEFIQAANHYINVISYEGNTSTTDVWEQCYISNAPIGIQTSGANLGIRFNSCILETLDTYGLDLAKECYSWEFNNTYVEDVPSANVAGNSCFRVGFSGTTLAASPQLIIKGGYIAGRNAGGVGALLDVDYTDGVTLGGFIAARFTNVVRTSANTQTNQVFAQGWIGAGIGTMVSDTTKISGIYPIGSFNSGTRNAQTIKLVSGSIDSVTAATQVDAGRLLLNTTAISVGAGIISHGSTTETTVGAAGGASALPATPLGYLVSYVGAQQVKIPYYLP